jgi:hypothetical protein
LLGLKELNKNQILCGQGILGQDQAIFTIKGRISGIKERKNTSNPDFTISNKTTGAISNYVPRGETVTETYIHKDLAKI